MQLQAVFCRAASASMAPTLPRNPGALSKGPHPLCPAASSVRQREAEVTHAALNRDEAARDRRLSVPRLAKRRIERCFVANAPEQNTPISSAFLRRGASTRPATVRSGESSERPARAARKTRERGMRNSVAAVGLRKNAPIHPELGAALEVGGSDTLAYLRQERVALRARGTFVVVRRPAAELRGRELSDEIEHF